MKHIHFVFKMLYFIKLEVLQLLGTFVSLTHSGSGGGPARTPRSRVAPSLLLAPSAIHAGRWVRALLLVSLMLTVI